MPVLILVPILRAEPPLLRRRSLAMAARYKMALPENYVLFRRLLARNRQALRPVRADTSYPTIPARQRYRLPVRVAMLGTGRLARKRRRRHKLQVRIALTENNRPCKATGASCKQYILCPYVIFMDMPTSTRTILMYAQIRPPHVLNFPVQVASVCILLPLIIYTTIRPVRADIPTTVPRDNVRRRLLLLRPRPRPVPLAILYPAILARQQLRQPVPPALRLLITNAFPHGLVPFRATEEIPLPALNHPAVLLIIAVLIRVILIQAEQRYLLRL